MVAINGSAGGFLVRRPAQLYLIAPADMRFAGTVGVNHFFITDHKYHPFADFKVFKVATCAGQYGLVAESEIIGIFTAA